MRIRSVSQPATSVSSRRWPRALAGGILYAGGLILLWHALVTVFDLPYYIVPKPAEVMGSLLRLPDYYARHSLVTLQEAAFGFVGGVTAGILAGLLLWGGGVAGRLASPILYGSQVFPKEALAPLFVTLFGFGVLPKILISALICFFPTAISTFRGLQETPRDSLRLMRAMGATRLQTLVRCRAPFAIPHVTAGLRVSATLAVVGAVVGEFVGASSGLGHVIRAANADIGTDRVYAALLLLGAIGSAMYGSAKFLESVLLRRFRLHGSAH